MESPCQGCPAAHWLIDNFPDFSDVKGLKGKMISTQGDVDHWEIKAVLSEPSSTEAIVDLLNNRIASKTPHTEKGPVTLRPPNADKSALDWKFTDEEGGEWTGEEKIEPAPTQQGQFMMTVKLARQLGNKST